MDATTTTPAPPEYTVDEVKATITEVFGPAHAEVAIGVAHCESRLNPRAISAGGGNWGLFQINQVHKQRVYGRRIAHASGSNAEPPGR